MEMKLAGADFTFPLLSHEKSLDLLAALEFEGVDIGLFENRSHLQPSDQLVDVEGSARQLKARLEDRGLRAADVFLQVHDQMSESAPNHPEASRRDKSRDWFQRTLDYAAALGADHVTGLPGVPIEDEPFHLSRGRAVEQLQWYVAEAAKYPLTYGVEPHIGSIAPDPAAAAALRADVPGLTWTLDYTHFIRDGMADADVEPLIEHASHFHVRGAAPGRLQTSFRQNVIDYRRVVQCMGETGYTGWVGVEYVWTEWERCDECDNLCETILFRDFLRSLASG